MHLTIIVQTFFDLKYLIRYNLSNNINIIHKEIEGGLEMNLGIWVVVGLIVILLCTAGFLLYFISSSMSTKSASKIDEVPENHLKSE